MRKQGPLACFLLILTILLSGCIGSLYTGASLVYDRHNLYKKLNDYQLYFAVMNALFVDRKFKKPNCIIDIAAFNGDVLIAGHLPTRGLLEEAARRLKTIQGYERLFNELFLSNAPTNTVQDTWITSKIRAGILADSSIDPNAFKVITSDRIVYLMGDVKSEQAEKVIRMARSTQGVVRVVKVFRYFTYRVQGPSFSRSR